MICKNCKREIGEMLGKGFVSYFYKIDFGDCNNPQPMENENE